MKGFFKINGAIQSVPAYKGKRYKTILLEEYSTSPKRNVENDVEEALATLPTYDIFIDDMDELNLDGAANMNILVERPKLKINIHNSLLSLHINTYTESEIHVNVQGESFLSMSFEINKNLHVKSRFNGEGELYENIRVVEEGIHVKHALMTEMAGKISTNIKGEAKNSIIEYTAKHIPTNSLKHEANLAAKCPIKGKLSLKALLTKKVNVELQPNIEAACLNAEITHNAAVFGINEEELFYLRTRGLNKKKAEAALIEAFKGSA